MSQCYRSHDELSSDMVLPTEMASSSKGSIKRLDFLGT